MLRAIALLFALSVLPAALHAQAVADPAEALRARLAALDRLDALDDSVARPVALGRAALDRAEARRTKGDDAGAGRAEGIARAALELAEARLRLLRERALLRAAEARAGSARADVARAERAIARERARLAELGPTDAAP